MTELPKHLQKYIVRQNYEKYTPVDQACWRYIMRQLKAFLAVHAHESYVQGLANTGVEIESIPRIENISRKLEQFGWRALPVSGFIPPAAFMELQSLGVLPIASDMRTLEHLSYTPAPDIVHEAAGHAPILVNPEFSKYLKQYAQVAKKAIISKEDLQLYNAIRILSDMKENPDSTSKQIEQAQDNLNQISKNMSHISEASLLARMNWWTAEYGLIGDIQNPKIFGAGLLSSVGESLLCLSEKVKKIPLTVDCITFGYDITEPQPQLFVTPNFENLTKVLENMANQMSFRTGGLAGIQKAITAESINSVELNSGIQISGVVSSVQVDKNLPIYINFQGPCQLSYQDHELVGHSKTYHKQGFGTALGHFQDYPGTCPSLLNDSELGNMGLLPNKPCNLRFTSGVSIEGTLLKILKKDGKNLLMSFENCTVRFQSKILFEPAWGTYDMAVGSSVVSVFGGPADRAAYGELEDFEAVRVPVRQFSSEQLALHSQYLKIRELREQNLQGTKLSNELLNIWKAQNQQSDKHWLLWLEAYELLVNRDRDNPLSQEILQALIQLKTDTPKLRTLIDDGLSLAKQL